MSIHKGKFHSTLSPILGDGVSVGIFYRTVKESSPDIHSLYVLEAYLSETFYNELRANRGLTYAPEAGQYSMDDSGLFVVEADVDASDAGLVLAVMHQEMNRITSTVLDKEIVEKVKRELILREAQGYEGSSEKADYYVLSRHELGRYGAFINEPERFELVTPESIQQVANMYLREEQGIEVYFAPTLTYVQFYVGLAMTALALMLGLVVYIRKRRNAGVT